MNVPCCEPYVLGRLIYKSPKINFIKNALKRHFSLAWALPLFLPDHRKTGWTMKHGYTINPKPYVLLYLIGVRESQFQITYRRTSEYVGIPESTVKRRRRIPRLGGCGWLARDVTLACPCGAGSWSRRTFTQIWCVYVCQCSHCFDQSSCLHWKILMHWLVVGRDATVATRATLVQTDGISKST